MRNKAGLLNKKKRKVNLSGRFSKRIGSFFKWIETEDGVSVMTCLLAEFGKGHLPFFPWHFS